MGSKIVTRGKSDLFFVTVLILLTAIVIPTQLLADPSEIKVICEDGENFRLEQDGSIVSAKTEQANKDLIVVDKDQLRLTLYREGREVLSYPVAAGTPETPSPVGEWKIIHKGGNWGSGFGDRWLGLNVPWGIYGIHGTNKPWLIGTRSSHGCIRMFNDHVIKLYAQVRKGTPVHIVGVIPPVVPRAEVGLKNTGRDVVAMQFALRKASFNPGTANGRFGPEMERAVRGFQDFYGLAPTGRLGQNEQYLLGLR